MALTSAGVIARFPDVAESVSPGSAVNVTSLPVEEFRVTGEEAPENERSVLPDELIQVMPPADLVGTCPFDAPA